MYTVVNGERLTAMFLHNYGTYKEDKFIFKQRMELWIKQKLPAGEKRQP